MVANTQEQLTAIISGLCAHYATGYEAGSLGRNTRHTELESKDATDFYRMGFDDGVRDRACIENGLTS